MTGVLQPVSLSMARRGTHAFMQGGEQTYFVESARKNLRDYEGVEVVITGLLEENIDPDALPVLVASGVTLVKQLGTNWLYPSLGLSFDTPSGWSGSLLQDEMEFVAFEGSSAIALRVSSASGQKLPIGGNALWIDSRPAVRVHGTTETTLWVQNGKMVIVFSFPTDADAEWMPTPEEIQWVIRSIRFTGIPKSSSSRASQSMQSVSSTSAKSGASAASSVGVGSPCGGAAGILCPSGQYCEVSDRVTDIGRCRPVAR